MKKLSCAGCTQNILKVTNCDNEKYATYCSGYKSNIRIHHLAGSIKEATFNLITEVDKLNLFHYQSYF